MGKVEVWRVEVEVGGTDASVFLFSCARNEDVVLLFAVKLHQHLWMGDGPLMRS